MQIPATDYSDTLLVHFRRVEKLKSDAFTCHGIDLNQRQLSELELLLNRAFFPLTGYLNRENYENVLEKMRLTNHTVWPVPVCLDVDEAMASVLSVGDRLALNDAEGFMLAVLTISEIWQPDLEREARCVYGTHNSAAHPGVRTFFSGRKPWYLAGNVEGILLPIHYDFKTIRLTPSETHRKFHQNGWRHVLGVHCDNFLHRVDREAILRAAREAGAHIFLHPMIGSDEPSDINHYTLVKCWQHFARRFPSNITNLGLCPKIVLGAGPREALWQAVIKKNYGCSHFLVLDDHCDPLSNPDNSERYYPRHAAQDLVREHEEEIEIKMVPFTRMEYVEEKAGFLPVPEIEDGMNTVVFSGTELRRRLESDLPVPDWFSYPEIISELKYTYRPRSRQGFTIFITGLSGAGKSTLARVLLVRFLEMRNRPVTLLDGDIVRKNLSSELSFTREHRNLNVTRIGFVAGEITKNGGIAICAPIAPFEESRRANRELISRYGGYIEVYMSTPQEICEQRDRKGLYVRARAGKIKGFTGVSDPYIPPALPDISLNTTEITPDEAAQEVLLFLEEKGYLT
ncbi:MAG: bifunctional sulfate adenylyltransferase/adenylylsulfate kinase [Proteobacteria bacterium]|nr:bifunctional sulfate adenylyltransferase/adenylylsulfate kinase [Pseudomonadota bacterium]MBU1736836.1 bifunctional sulfate adenylyltransferase/adenylylsulfate kinase [Pseudomonadota bacterium]